MYLWDFLPCKPFHDYYTVYTRSAFCTQLNAFYSQSAVCINFFSLSLNFTAGLQSAVHSLYFTLTALVSNDSNGLSVKLRKAIKA